MVDSLFLEVGLFDEHLSRCVKHSLGGVESDSLNGIDNPLIHLIVELIQIDIF